MKKIFAIVLSLVAAWLILAVVWWLVRNIFSLAMDLMGLVLVALVAVPIYVLIRRKL